MSRVVLLAALLLLAAAPAADGALTVRGSVEQVQVTGATAGSRLTLLDAGGRALATRRVNRLGGALFRGVRPGSGLRVRTAAGTRSRAVRVLPDRDAPPSTAGYRQRIPERGYGYLTTRDGTRLAINVRLPAGEGPFPTLVEYAGYGYADPAGAQSGISQIANLLGYAVVDVNMRGTGCSGGAFDFFESLQALDGYDVIETVARQPWVKHHRVGMLGISYGGISQLFVGARRPPSLAAITPLSVIDDTITTLYPGGILNTGFALSWAADRDRDAQPASESGGQPWALRQIRGGDRTCAANQALHPEAVGVVAKVRRNRFYVPRVADPLAPVRFVDRIGVPVFLACQFTDEQTGGHCPALERRFTGTRRKWFTFTNGTHVDALAPATFQRWFDFLELYVARRAPALPAGARALAPTIFAAVTGVPGQTLPDDPFQGRPSYAEALTAFEAQPPVRVLFDSGGGGSTPGAPVPAYERSFSAFPPPTAAARSWYLRAGGTLSTARAPAAGANAFTWDPAARPPTSFSGDTGSGPGGLWTTAPSYRWTQPRAGRALSYVTAPLAQDTTVLGAGAVELWVRASVPSADLQATVSEVRPDGRETYVQSGWVRPSLRKLDARRSTLLEPVLSLRRSDAGPLPRGRLARVLVPLYYQGHDYRAGSRIRLAVSAPGGDQPTWAFAETVPRGRATVAVAFSARRASRLVLPVVPGLGAPTPLPPCPGLRGEPCRTYEPLANRSAR